MAQKKVSSRNKKSDKKSNNEQAIIYNDFVAKHGAEIRKRSTKTVAEPKKQVSTDGSLSRCGEINPHTTHNPTAQHQIISKRSGRMLSDDSGFKAENYNDRFALAPEMPQIEPEADLHSAVSEQQGIPGQQTMAEMFLGSDAAEAVNAPEEAQNQEENPFLKAYVKLRNENTEYGKSEKLKAIARTATDDAGMEPESQLAFPSFDPLFKFPEEEEKKEKRVKRTSKFKKNNKKEEKAEAFDIDESQIVSSHKEEEPKIKKQKKPTENNSARKFFDFLSETKNASEVAPPYEINSKNELRQAIGKLSSSSKTALIQSIILLAFGIILFIISAVFDNKPDSALRSAPVLYSGICILFTLLAGAVCIKELAEGIKDFARKKLTINTGGIIIIICALLQCFTSLFYGKSFGGTVRLTVSAAIISMIFVVLPKFFLSNNAKLTAGMFAHPVKMLKTAQDGGIDGSLKEKYASDGVLRYSEKTDFALGLMHTLTNAVPKLYGSNASYLFLVCFSLAVSVAAGIIGKSFMLAVSAFSSVLITGLPISYILSASLVLYNTNSAIAAQKSSLLSYRMASSLTKTGAIVFDGAEITEQTASSIHGVKNFGFVSPQKATLCCAAVVKAANSPLAHIMKQVTDQSGEEIPEAENLSVTAFGGIKATVEGEDVLLGSREFLEKNNVLIPNENFEEKFITGDRKLLYLAVGGEFSMLLIVSYHIKRSVSALIKYLISKNISPVIYSSDPNVTANFIAKKCKVPEDKVFEADEAESAYLQDKASKTSPALPSDVFTNGSLSALSLLIRSAFSLSSYIELLPYVMYAIAALSVILIAVPMLSGSAFAVSNLYILAIRTAGFAVAIAVHAIKSKRGS